MLFRSVLRFRGFPSGAELVHGGARIETPAVLLEPMFLTTRHHCLSPAAVGGCLGEHTARPRNPRLPVPETESGKSGTDGQ